jgi:putative flippase GtrA
MKADLARLVRFCMVGAVNTGLTLVTFVGLTRAGVSPVPASALAFSVGALNGYLLNARWTFRMTSRGASRILRYVLVQALGAGMSASAIALLSSELAFRHLVAEAIVLPFVTLATYTLSRRLVFDIPTVAAQR